MAFDQDQSQDYRVDLNWEGGSHTFLFRGGILHHPALCSASSEAIGYAIAQWARLETHMDSVIFQLNQKQFYPNVDWVTEKHPTNFPDKLDMLKRLFRWHPAISHRSKDVVSFAGKMKTMAETRNVIAHSVFAGVDESTHELLFHAFIVNRNGDIKLKISKFTFAGMGAYARDIDKLNLEFCNISSQILRKETFQRLRELLPQNPAYIQ